MSDTIKIGITVGDINGIGPEIVLKTFTDNRLLDFCIPVIYCNPKVIAYYKKALKINDFNYTKLNNEDEIKGKKVFLKQAWKEEVKINMGESTPEGGKYAIKSLKAATQDLAENKIDVLLTAPINKNNVQSSEFNFPGHTEYLAKMSNVKEALMIMVTEKLKVAVVTGHIPLKEVAQHLTEEKIVNAIKKFNDSLIKDFGIAKPKLAVLGLNPHAGDNGLLGDEEIKIINPAINKAKNKNILAFGPYSADGFFGGGNFMNFDGVLAMYHDQGLIPFKSISFGDGVNYTAGLPIVRTSPDHGTAYEIAGQGRAKISSFRNALFLALDIYKNRKMHKELNENSLPLSKK